jgi:YHS domain-containing protein
MRLLFPLLIFLLVFYFLRHILRALTQGKASPKFGVEDMRHREHGRSVKMGKMEKDPVCGTFVDVATSLKATFGGEPKYFCSAECLNKYKQSR